MSRKKKKQTRKFKPKNEFRYNNSPLAKGHPNYVFGETETKYKSLGLTHNPQDEVKHIKLNENPNPSDKRPAYLRMRVLSSNKKYMSEPLTDWKFSNKDMPFVRHTVKKYKKSVNRQPKNWYTDKKKK